jgi:hypothetical protein
VQLELVMAVQLLGRKPAALVSTVLEQEHTFEILGQTPLRKRLPHHIK